MESQKLGRKVQFFMSGKLYDMILYSADYQIYIYIYIYNSAIQLKLCFKDIILIIIMKVFLAVSHHSYQ